jgi:hypothetical protein
MSLLLLGLDSLFVCLAIGSIVERRSRLKLAAVFGAADGLAFLVAAGLGFRLFSDSESAVLTSGMLAAVAFYLIVVAAGARRVTARWPVWVLPGALVFDNLTYGLMGDRAAGSLLQQAGEQALSSALLALVGLLAAAAVHQVIRNRAAPDRVAGGALLLAATGLVLLG